MTTLQVTILGQTFALRSEASAEEIRQVADFVNRQLEEVAAQGRSADSLNVALLALFNVAGAYLRQTTPGAAEGQAAFARLERLLERVEAGAAAARPGP